MPEQTSERAQQRLDQIVQSAVRVTPTAIGVWRMTVPWSKRSSDAVVIAPADLAWMVEALRTPPESPSGGES